MLVKVRNAWGSFTPQMTVIACHKTHTITFLVHCASDAQIAEHQGNNVCP